MRGDFVERIVSLNVRQGGGKRAQKIVEWLCRQEPDHIVLSEWKYNDAGVYFIVSLIRAGYCVHPFCSFDKGKTSSVFFASKNNQHHANPVQSPDFGSKELGFITFPHFSLCVCYFPLGKKKAPFFHACAKLAKDYQGKPFLLLGDLNTGCCSTDKEHGSTKFPCEDLFLDLTQKSHLTDLWRSQHGDATKEWSWRSSKSGFRIDHAFVNEQFLDKFPQTKCTYDHTPREIGLSDHSALILEMA
jgi:exonuclease III